MDWNDLRFFLALARTGSVRAAGAHLGVSHSTVLRRVEALEEQLGTRLFDRSRGGFALTQAGADMVPGAERIEAEAASIERSLLGLDDHLEGEICITCSDAWIVDLVLQILHPFCTAHPEITLRVGEDGRLFDMSKREADIAVRTMPVSKQPPSHLIGTRLAPLRMGIYVARTHAARFDPERADSEARWVAFDDAEAHRNLATATNYASLDAWGGFSSVSALVSALNHGYGIGMLPIHVGDAEPLLRRTGVCDLPHLGDLWLLSHPDLRTNARLRACRQALIAGFQQHQARFDGSGEPTTNCV